MSEIETYYLIDFENVNNAGVACKNQLGSHDHIHIFFTKNTPTISTESLESFNNIDWNSHVIPAGKQSLDMHLIAYLGYLIGKNEPDKCKYIIVSKDKDYDNVISFLKEITSSTITRQSKITVTPPKNPVTTKTTSPSGKTSSLKTQLNTEIQRSISAAGYDKAVVNKVASIVSKYYGNEHFSRDVHNELQKTYTDYIDIYQIVKPITKKYTKNTTTKAISTSSLNHKIQQILSKASYNNKIISFVASLVCKHYRENNAKQSIYRAIINQYGQKQGLNIYNHIKKSL